MPDGRTHLAINNLGSAVVFGVAYVTVGTYYALIAAIAYIVGEVLLSPDLDHNVGANAYRRWWLLRFIWWLYMRLIPHRSPLSHWPIIGTLGRLLYLGLIVAAVAGLARAGGYHLPIPVHLWPEGVTAVIGLELAADTHWVADRFW